MDGSADPPVEDVVPQESINKKIARGIKPRVHLTYDVEVGDAIEQKELPFVVGVLADLSGQPKAALAPVKQRKFVEISRDNFNQVLEGLAPRLAYRAPNAISGEGGEVAVELNFRHLDDFGPEAVAQQVEPIRKLVEARRKLNELALKIGTNDKLAELLDDIVKNPGTMKDVVDDTPTSKPGPGGSGDNG